jgi:hypothetical protein
LDLGGGGRNWKEEEGAGFKARWARTKDGKWLERLVIFEF